MSAAGHRQALHKTSSPLSAEGSAKVGTIEQPKFLPHWDQTELCVSPGNIQYLVTPRKRRKDESFSTTLRSWIVDHQIGLSINLLVLLSLVHICFPRARRRTTPFFTLSYHDPFTDTYTRGTEDFYFVTCWIVIFFGLRAATLQYVLLPFAQFAGLDKPKQRVRFAEQAWLFLYDTVFWTLGMYNFTQSKYFMNFPELWTDFPAREMAGTFKWYYLVQFAFWVQQIVVVNIEERRKDHWQMFTHHVVTCLLMIFSYGYYQQRVGNVILCLMDVVDIALPAAKMLKYTGFQKLCDVMFGVFIFTWIMARHVLYLMVMWSIHTDVPWVMTYGCYNSQNGDLISTPSLSAGSQANLTNFDPNFAETYGSYGTSDILSNTLQPYTNPGGTICYHARIRHAFLVLLAFLQGIMLIWLAMILRVAWKVVTGNGADDSRSDDEEDEEDVDLDEDRGFMHEPPALPHAATLGSIKPIEIEAPLEEYVGVEGLNLTGRATSPRAGSRGRTAPSRSKKSATSTGFMGHADRKELLGRIGCDKPVGSDDE